MPRRGEIQIRLLAPFPALYSTADCELRLSRDRVSYPSAPPVAGGVLVAMNRESLSATGQWAAAAVGPACTGVAGERGYRV